MLRYGRESFVGVVAGAILGAILYLASAAPALLAGSSIAAQLLPIGLAVAALAGAMVGVAVVFGVLVALVIRDRELDAASRARQKAAGYGAAIGVVALAVGMWFIQGAPRLVPVSLLAVVAICALLSVWGARFGVRHADSRIEHAAARDDPRERASV